jgi:hypothetical protein
MAKKDNSVLLSRPKDRSVAAYKAWITELFTHITGRTDDDDPPEVWERDCKAFWAKVDGNGGQDVTMSDKK